MWPMIGAAVGGLLSYFGQEETNENNYRIAQETSAFNAQQAELTRNFNSAEAIKARDFNADQAGLNRSFQADQIAQQQYYQQYNADTAWRRGINDMKEAGLNPMLAYSKGGAVAPTGGAASGATASGPAASGPMASGVQATMQNSMASAMQAAQTTANVEKTHAETKNIEAQTITEAQRAGHTEAMKDNIRQEMKSFEKRMEKLGYETDLAHSKATVGLAQRNIATHRYNWAADLAKAERDALLATADKLRNQANLLGLEVPAAVNDAIHHLKYEYYRQNVGPFIPDGSSAAGIIRSLRGR